jgi:hypothetical protein
MAQFVTKANVPMFYLASQPVKTSRKVTKSGVLSSHDWDDVADLCEQAASGCENCYEDHTKKARKRASRWFRSLAMKAQRRSMDITEKEGGDSE